MEFFSYGENEKSNNVFVYMYTHIYIYKKLHFSRFLLEKKLYDRYSDPLFPSTLSFIFILCYIPLFLTLLIKKTLKHFLINYYLLL